MSEVRLNHTRRGFSSFATIGTIILAFFLIQAAGTIFLELGIPFWVVILIIPGSLIGSLVNIHVATLETNPEGCEAEEYVTVWGVAYKVHYPECPGELELGVNLGGAIIPIVVSSYLLLMNPDLLMITFASTIMVMIFVNRIARIVPEVGIVTPSLLPPLMAGITATLFYVLLGGLSNPYVVAYVSGTLGTLIGADLLNIPKLGELKTGKASIGGAGTWDGVFLTGLLAVFFVGL